MTAPGSCQSFSTSGTICVPDPLALFNCSCSGGKILDSTSNCVCPTGSVDDGSGLCVSICATNCSTCWTNQTSHCLSCLPGYFLLNYTCISPCPYNYLADSITGVCLKCDIACAGCANTELNCLACATGYFPQPPVTPKKCDNKCPLQYYLDRNNYICKPCDIACLNCTDSTPYCITCVQTGGKLNGKCVSSCPNFYYRNSTSGQCLPCDSSCKTCMGPTNRECLSCTTLQKYVLNGVCRPCDVSCYQCIAAGPLACISCNAGYYLNITKCTAINCPDGKYYDVGALRCLDCPTTCSACSSYVICTSCVTGYMLDVNECKLCENFVGYYTSGSGDCAEKCGDGINLGQYACDDGNVANGDGCSDICTVEKGWTCSGGNQYAPDFCSLLSHATVNFTGNSPGTEAVITMTFSEVVTMIGPSWTSTIQILLVSNLEQVNAFTVQQSIDNPTIWWISLPYNSPKNGDPSTYMIVLLEPNNLLDIKDNSVSFTSQSVAVYFLAESKKPVLSSTGKTIFTVIFGLIGLGVILTGGMRIFWRMMDSLQTLSYFALLTVDYPEILSILFSLSEIGNLSWLPNPIILIAQLFNIDIPPGKQPPEKFDAHGYSSQFLINSGQFFSAMLGLGLGHFLVSLYRRKHGSNSIKAIGRFFDWDMIFGTSMSVYFASCIGCFLQITNVLFDGAFNGISSTLSFIFLLVFCCTPPFLYDFLKRNSRRFKSRAFLNKYGILYKQYKQDAFLSKYFTVVVLFCKLMFSLSLVTLTAVPVLQTLGIVVSKVILSVILIKYKPLIDRLEGVVALINEMLSAITGLFIVGLIQTNGSRSLILLTFAAGCAMILSNMYIAIREQAIVIKEKFFTSEKKKKIIEKKRQMKTEVEFKTEIKEKMVKVKQNYKVALPARQLKTITQVKHFKQTKVEDA